MGSTLFGEKWMLIVHGCSISAHWLWLQCLLFPLSPLHSCRDVVSTTYRMHTFVMVPQIWQPVVEAARHTSASAAVTLAASAATHQGASFE
jgi:hypothetical protein